MKLRHLPKHVRQALSFVDAQGMHDLIKAKSYRTFADMHELLCKLCEQGTQLSEDQESAGCVAFELFGEDTGAMLREFRRRGDIKPNDGSPGRKEREVLAHIDADTFKALHRGPDVDPTAKKAIYDAVKRIRLIATLSPGQQDYVDLFDATSRQT